MASNTGVRTELYRDQFGILLEDLSNRMLELKWLDGSSAMTDEDFKAWLEPVFDGSRNASSAASRHRRPPVSPSSRARGRRLARRAHHSPLQPCWRAQVRVLASRRLARSWRLTDSRAAGKVSDGVFRSARENRGLVQDVADGVPTREACRRMSISPACTRICEIHGRARICHVGFPTKSLTSAHTDGVR